MAQDLGQLGATDYPTEVCARAFRVVQPWPLSLNALDAGVERFLQLQNEVGSSFLVEEVWKAIEQVRLAEED